jgi:hypothetical protein
MSPPGAACGSTKVNTKAVKPRPVLGNTPQPEVFRYAWPFVLKYTGRQIHHHALPSKGELYLLPGPIQFSEGHNSELDCDDAKAPPGVLHTNYHSRVKESPLMYSNDSCARPFISKSTGRQVHHQCLQFTCTGEPH